MPEGHVIHRAARDQRPMLEGKRIAVTSPQGRFDAGAAMLDGRLCRAVEAYGKHLIYRFEDELALHIHLGLFGRIRTHKQPATDPRGAVRVRLASETHIVDINGPNNCEVMDEAELASLIARIGPDVLRDDADPNLAFERISASRTGIGLLLMDQSVIAGIGNIYRTEILWRQGIHPATPGRDISRRIFKRIWADSVALLTLGMKKNAIITVEGGTASKARYGERVNIFAKTVCPACDGPVTAMTLAGRKAYACEACQPPA